MAAAAASDTAGALLLLLVVVVVASAARGLVTTGRGTSGRDRPMEVSSSRTCEWRMRDVEREGEMKRRSQ
jgi:hypothetical protein